MIVLTVESGVLLLPEIGRATRMYAWDSAMERGAGGVLELVVLQ